MEYSSWLYRIPAYLQSIPLYSKWYRKTVTSMTEKEHMKEDGQLGRGTSMTTNARKKVFNTVIANLPE